MCQYFLVRISIRFELDLELDNYRFRGVTVHKLEHLFHQSRIVRWNHIPAWWFLIFRNMLRHSESTSIICDVKCIRISCFTKNNHSVRWLIGFKFEDDRNPVFVEDGLL